MESVKEYLQDKHLLLLLDNFEQVVAAGGVLAELLTAAPHSKALITSRASLNLHGEHTFPVAPLQVPSQQGTPFQSVSDVNSIQLFVERAQAVRPQFHLTEENALFVTQIVRRLDGLPLAIELAAARLKLLSPQILLDRLDDRLDLLIGGAQICRNGSKRCVTSSIVLQSAHPRTANHLRPVGCFRGRIHARLSRGRVSSERDSECFRRHFRLARQ